METGQRLEGMASTLRSLTTSFLPVIGLFLLLLVSLYLMSDATQNSERFGRLYISLLFFNSLILIFLLVMIGMNLFELLRQMSEGSQSDPAERIAELVRRRDEIDAQIARIEAGDIPLLDDTALRDRFQQFLQLSRELLERGTFLSFKHLRQNRRL